MVETNIAQDTTPSEELFSTWDSWSAIDWPKIIRKVREEQNGLMKAYKMSRHRHIAWLQQSITRSTEAKALAVKLTAKSRGASTAGADGQLWNSDESKYQAISAMQPENYHPSPYLRKSIPKLDGGTRILNIPTLADRAMQTLYKLALEPIAECTADENSFGFRYGRNAHDAIAKCEELIGSGAKYVLEGDIQNCFDSLSHDWLLENIPMECDILSKMLKCSSLEYTEKTVRTIPRSAGASQGGPISPILCNMALDGMRRLVKRTDDSAELMRYADDFIVTSNSIGTIREVLPKIEDFLRERGLALSSAKTAITPVSKGFDFLGCTITPTTCGVLVRPQAKSVEGLKERLSVEIRQSKSASVGLAVERLNLIIRGWCNYYQFYDSMDAFSEVDCAVSELLMQCDAPKEIDELRYKAANTTKSKYIPIEPFANPHSKKYRAYFRTRQPFVSKVHFLWDATY